MKSSLSLWLQKKIINHINQAKYLCKDISRLEDLGVNLIISYDQQSNKFFVDGISINKDECCACTLDWDEYPEALENIKNLYGIEIKLLGGCQCNPSETEVNELIAEYHKSQQLECTNTLTFKYQNYSWALTQPTYFQVYQSFLEKLNQSLDTMDSDQLQELSYCEFYLEPKISINNNIIITIQSD